MNSPALLRPAFTNQKLTFAGAIWLIVAVVAGLLISTQSIGFIVIAAAIVAMGLLILIAPIVPFLPVLILAPMRTLIETESSFHLPLEIGRLSVLGLIAAWASYRIARHQRLLSWVWSDVYLPLLGFIAITGLTIFSATSTGAWLSEWLKWVLMLVMVILVMDTASGGKWEWILFGLVLAGAANALVGIYIFFGGSGAEHLLINNHYFRAFGTFGQPNPFGGFMGLLAPLALMSAFGYAVISYRHWRSARQITIIWLAASGFYALAFVLLSTGVVMSWSRGAWLGFVISLFVLVAALPHKFWHSFALLAFAGSAVFAAWHTGQLPAAITERIESASEEFFAFDDMRGVDINDENYAVVERLAHWQAALNMARQHPWLGVGMGNYEVVYPDYRLFNWHEPLGHAHNYYLNVLAEAGIIGLLTYLVLWISIIRITWRARQHPDFLSRCVTVGLLGTWAYLLVHSLTDDLYVNNLFLHLGVMLGILAVLHQQAWERHRLGRYDTIHRERH